MTHHFGVLIPSTNTTVETELSGLPAGYQAHYGRLLTSTPGTPVRAEPGRGHRLPVEAARHRQSRDGDTDPDLGEPLRRRLRRDGHAAHERRRRRAGDHLSPVGGARAASALGARRIALVSPYSEEVNERARRYFGGKHGLEIAVVDGFAATDSYAIGKLEPENARDAFARIDRPDIDAFVVPGRQLPDDGVDRRAGSASSESPW